MMALGIAPVGTLRQSALRQSALRQLRCASFVMQEYRK
jgi:hypothetical protein